MVGIRSAAYRVVDQDVVVSPNVEEVGVDGLAVDEDGVPAIERVTGVTVTPLQKLQRLGDAEDADWSLADSLGRIGVVPQLEGVRAL